MFHLLSPPDSHQGGKSVLVDGFRAAHLLKAAHPACYELLSTLSIPTHASGGPDTLIKPKIARPVLEHDAYGKLAIVRWNSDDRAVVGQGLAWQGEVQLDDGRVVDKVQGFYEASKVWEKLLRAEDSQYWFQLEASKPMSE
jgi:trimethyllysine dioxygenase